MTQFGWADCSEPVRSQVLRLVQGLNNALGATLRGVYLHGSLAMGCFNPLRSDIDLLVLIDAELTAAQRHALVALLPTISAQPAPIELSVLSAAALTPWRHPAPYELHYGESWRAAYLARPETITGGLDADLAGHMTVARERGIALFGPEPRTTLPEPPREDFLASILSDVLSEEFGVGGLVKSTNATYVILNTCRTLGYLRTGRIMSKDEGGLWALLELPWRYSSMTARALEKYRAYGDSPEYTAGELAQFSTYALAELRNRKAR